MPTTPTTQTTPSSGSRPSLASELLTYASIGALAAPVAMTAGELPAAALCIAAVMVVQLWRHLRRDGR